MTSPAEVVVAEFGQRLSELGWVRALHVGGSLATGDHHAATSDLDLVAVTEARLSHAHVAQLRSLHRAVPADLRLGCVYVAAELVAVPEHEHPTWTHGLLIDRWLSGIARAELLQAGYAVFGPQPNEVWPAMTAADIRAAVRDELTGYWSWALRRPWLWFARTQIDLAVTTMLRARHTLASGELLTKSVALSGAETARLPRHLVRAVQDRRVGRRPAHERALLPVHAALAWRLTRQTVTSRE